MEQSRAGSGSKKTGHGFGLHISVLAAAELPVQAGEASQAQAPLS